MNRRGFLNSLLKVGAAAFVAPTILPAATTYMRRWKRPAGIRFFIPTPKRIFYPYQLGFMGSISDCRIVHPTPTELDAIFRDCLLEHMMTVKNNLANLTFVETPQQASLYSFLHGL